MIRSRVQAWQVAIALLASWGLAACGPAEGAPETAAEPDPASQRSPAAARFDNDRERPGELRPLPEDAVTGKDADHDHIRDDVAAFIDAEYGHDELARLGARQLARAYQHGLAYGGEKDTAIAAAHESGRAIRCLFEHVDDDVAGDMVGELEARTVDNEERLAAYRAQQRNLSGAYFPDVRDAQAGCRFDTRGLVR
jgi:hypothetical protein